VSPASRHRLAARHPLSFHRAFFVPARFFPLIAHRCFHRAFFLSSRLSASKIQPFPDFSIMSYSTQHLRETSEIIAQLNPEDCEQCVRELVAVRTRGGRLFILGVGGSAANASHAVNDFRKIGGLECYAPTDNVSELTARTNDEGWASVFVEWLRGSRLKKEDALLILSVGGGNLEKNVSPNLVTALQFARQIGARIIGIVGKDGGFTATVADACVIVPTVNPNNITPHSEAFQAVIWHLFVSHPDLKMNQTKWESVAIKPLA